MSNISGELILLESKNKISNERERGNRERERGKSVNFPNIHGGFEDDGRELKERKKITHGTWRN